MDMIVIHELRGLLLTGWNYRIWSVDIRQSHFIFAEVGTKVVQLLASLFDSLIKAVYLYALGDVGVAVLPQALFKICC